MEPLFVLLMVTLLFHATTEEDNNTSKVLSKSEYEDIFEEIFKPSLNESTSEGHKDLPNESHSCHCVPFYLCVNDTVQTNGENVIDVRIPKQNLCTDPLETCCSKVIGQPLITDVPIESYDENAIPKCGGQSNTNGSALSKVIGKSNESDFADYLPWFVAIFREKENTANDDFLCGGSLIHPKVVLTAVHCIINTKPNKLKVHAGEWMTHTNNYRLVTKIIKHEKFYGCGRQNDIALLVVNVRYDLQRDKVATLCLPPQDYTFTSGQKCQYLRRSEKLPGRDEIFYITMEKIYTPIVHRDECAKTLRRSRLGSDFCLHESFMCAGGKIDQTTCNRDDGGGPLMCPVEGRPGRLQQAGIVSWSIGCDGRTPGVYANVARFRQWIDYQMLYHNLNPAYYDATYDDDAKLQHKPTTAS